MKTIIVTTTLFLLCCFVKETKEDNAVIMSAYKLALMWPPQYCARQARLQLPRQCQKGYANSFMVHGLWPMDAKGKSLDAGATTPCQPIGKPAYMGSVKVPIESQKEEVKREIETYWKDLTRPDPYPFWNYQWRKHGRCSNFPQDPAAYFKFAAEQAKKYNILQILEKEGIRPSDTVTYSFSKFSDAFRKGMGVQVQIRCVDGNPIEIAEVRICMDPNAKLIDCSNPNSGCRDKKGGTPSILIGQHPKD